MELVRILGDRGSLDKESEVYGADSVHFPLGRFSKVLKKTFRVPSPVEDEQGFIDALKKIIVENQIDLIIPTCEEVFYISKYKAELEEACCRVAGTEIRHVFTDFLEKLNLLHNKRLFTDYCRSLVKRKGRNPLNIKVPPVFLSLEDTRGVNSERWVVKRVYSRFSAHTRILDRLPKRIELGEFLQPYIAGKLLCSYSAAVNGVCRFHTTYENLATYNAGTGIAFQAVDEKRISDFVKNVASDLDYTGQLAFDFILDDKNQLWVLECNPRLTSGIHLFKTLPFRFWEAPCRETGPQHEDIATPVRLTIPLLLLMFQKQHRKRVKELFKNSKEAVFNRRDPFPFIGQFISYLEFKWMALRRGISTVAAMTCDIEWNGENE